MTATAAIEMEHVVPAPIEEVWACWARRERLIRWDPTAIDGEIEEGKELLFHWKPFGVSLPLFVVTLEPLESLYWRARWPEGGNHDVSLRFEALSPERCRICLEVFGDMKRDEQEGLAAGWHTQLRVLAAFLAASPVGPRSDRVIAGLAHCTAIRAFGELSRLSSWLGNPVALDLREQGEFELSLLAGPTVKGHIISWVPGRELALWINELGGILRTRALPMGPRNARLVGIQVMRWGECSQAEEFETIFQQGVARLLQSLGAPPMPE